MDKIGRGVELQVTVFCNVTILSDWWLQPTANGSAALNHHFIGVGLRIDEDRISQRLLRRS